MPYYAQITAGIVTAVTETADTIDAPNMIAIDGLDTSKLGKAYGAGVFSTAPDIRPRHITAYAFKSRMTSAERIAIRAAATSSAVVADWLDLADSARYIDLDRAATRAGVQGLEAGGLLGAGRALEILDAEVQESERP